MKGKLVTVWVQPTGTYVSSITRVKEVGDCSLKDEGEMSKLIEGLEKPAHHLLGSLVLVRDDLTHEIIPVPEKYK